MGGGCVVRRRRRSESPSTQRVLDRARPNLTILEYNSLHYGAALPAPCCPLHLLRGWAVGSRSRFPAPGLASPRLPLGDGADAAHDQQEHPDASHRGGFQFAGAADKLVRCCHCLKPLDEGTCHAARLHRRRFHRRHRSRQHAGARRHAHHPDHRRARRRRSPRMSTPSWWRSSRAPFRRREAVAQSLAALAWLQAAGCRQIYFKYCSTFDSTPKRQHRPGDRRADGRAAAPTSPSPARHFPETGRTICHGYLFVGDVLLSESGMKDHPLTPMTDANLVRVLQPQTRRKVGLIRYARSARGAAALREEIATSAAAGHRHRHRRRAGRRRSAHCIAEGCADLPLVTAGSGVGLGIAEHHRRAGLLSHAPRPPRCRACKGHAAVLSGSCSDGHQRPGRALACRSRPPSASIRSSLAAGTPVVEEALAWARRDWRPGPVLIYATSDSPRR